MLQLLVLQVLVEAAEHLKVVKELILGEGVRVVGWERISHYPYHCLKGVGGVVEHLWILGYEFEELYLISFSRKLAIGDRQVRNVVLQDIQRGFRVLESAVSACVNFHAKAEVLFGLGNIEAGVVTAIAKLRSAFFRL